MQYTTTVLLAALSTASGVLAAPHHRDNWWPNNQYGDNQNQQPDDKDVIRLGLGIPGGEGGTTFGLGPITGDFTKKVEFEVRKSSNGEESLFTTVEFQIGENIQNKDLRCKVLDGEGKEVSGKRGTAPEVNYDDTFGDKGKGAWTFIKETSTVSKIVCDPAFKPLSKEEMLKGRQTTVELRTEVGAEMPLIVGPFEPFTEELKNQVKDLVEADKAKDFKSVNVKVGRFTVPQTLRCSVQGVPTEQGAAGTNVIGQRKANIDETFSDGGKGEWTFVDQNVAKPDALPPAAVAHKVSSVTCDSTFEGSNGPVVEAPMYTASQQ